MANIGYVRVSTAEQNTSRQFADFEEKGMRAIADILTDDTEKQHDEKS